MQVADIITTTARTRTLDREELQLEHLTGEVPCAHCGAPTQRSEEFPAEPQFCCNGCKTVYEILAANDLCTYYAFDELTSDRRRPHSADYEILEHATVASRFITSRTATHVVCTFVVPGMHCASCVWLLERLHRIDPGIYESSVDLTLGTVRIAFNPQRTSLRKVAELLASLNFNPSLESENVQSRTQQASLLSRLGIAGFAMMNVTMLSIAGYLAGEGGLAPTLQHTFQWISILLSVPVVVYAASPWWTSAWKSLRKASFSLDVPVAAGIAAIFIRSYADVIAGVGTGFLDAATGLVFFLLIGRLIQERAFAAISFDRTVRSFFPLGVRVQAGQHFDTQPIETLNIGDVIELRNGEVLPCEAVLLDDIAYLDYAFVTGESTPHLCVARDRMLAGGRVIGGAMRCVVSGAVSNGLLTTLWERASVRRSRTRLLGVASRFGAGFTVITVAIAITAFFVWLPDVAGAVSALTAVLIIACPCAMTLAAPMALGTAMGLLGQRGIMIRNTGTLLELDAVTHVVFDKTGTLTRLHRTGTYIGEPLTPSQCSAIASVVAESTHPVSRAIGATFGVPTERATDMHEAVGQGLKGTAHGHRIAIGSQAWLESDASNVENVNSTHISVDGRIVGKVVLREKMREGAVELMQAVGNSYGLSVFSGDQQQDTSAMHELLASSDVRLGMLPEEKISAVAELQRRGQKVLMVGDGLNDAGAMNTANVAIAISNNNATIVPACDVIVSADSIGSISSLLKYAGAVRRVIITAFIVSLLYNAVGLTLAVSGSLSPLAVAVLMPVSSLTIIGIAVGGARIAVRRLAWK